MGFTLTYRPLATIKIWHHYFLDDNSGDFLGFNQQKREKGLQNYQITEFLRISPTADTQKKLRGHQVLLKVQPDGFVLAAKADPADTSKMFNPLGSGDILRFVLTTDRDDFKHFTNLRTNANELVYLCNQPHQNTDYPFISQWPPLYDGGLVDGNPDTFAYPSGAMLVDSLPSPGSLKIANQATDANFSDNAVWKIQQTGDAYTNGTAYSEGDRVHWSSGGNESIYEALEETSGNAPSDTSKWVKVIDLPVCYVNASDVKTKLENLYQYQFGAASLVYRFTVTDIQNTVLLEKTVESEVAGELFQMDLSKLPSALLKITVRDTATDTIVEQSEGVLLHQGANKGKIVGIVELTARPAATAYQMLNGTDEFQQPEFQVFFKNRSTVWRYLDQNENEVLKTPEPRPLILRGYQKITHNGVDLPNPDTGMIRPTPQQDYSEVFI
jgi:hypothetical protein